MQHGVRGDWSRIRRLLNADPNFGRALIESLAHDHGYSPGLILMTLSEAEVSALWEWMLVQYPTAEDPDRSRSGEVTLRHAVANLRDNLVSHLANIGTGPAVISSGP